MFVQRPILQAWSTITDLGLCARSRSSSLRNAKFIMIVSFDERCMPSERFLRSSILDRTQATLSNARYHRTEVTGCFKIELFCVYSGVDYSSSVLHTYRYWTKMPRFLAPSDFGEVSLELLVLNGQGLKHALADNYDVKPTIPVANILPRQWLPCTC